MGQGIQQHHVRYASALCRMANTVTVDSIAASPGNMETLQFIPQRLANPGWRVRNGLIEKLNRRGGYLLGNLLK